MNTQSIVHKEIEAMQVACIKTVIEKRADALPLFEPLRQACGDAICGPAMIIYHHGAVKEGLLVEAAFPVSRPVECVHADGANPSVRGSGIDSKVLARQPSAAPGPAPLPAW